ncbi:hypothetical protein GCM10025868_16160 [Angustibacter aerolatus]|uniref:Acyltransferase 3 domain-containing protein n=1 Tax=Angustibacter aerolatus TaxID=1162965 RepID=A0ABQ6JDV9_9ACTN|nr:hypothetical protein GCM10025868_16160 [Angustibacter aerolatus]
MLGQNAVIRALWRPPGTKGVYIERHALWLVVGLTLCYALVAAVALGWFRFARWRWLTVAGALTYPFYLVHEHLGWFWIRVLRRYLHLPVPLVLLLTAASMLTLAWLIHRFVERPLGPWLKRGLAQQAAAIRLKTAARP